MIRFTGYGVIAEKPRVGQGIRPYGATLFQKVEILIFLEYTNAWLASVAHLAVHTDRDGLPEEPGFNSPG